MRWTIIAFREATEEAVAEAVDADDWVGAVRAFRDALAASGRAGDMLPLGVVPGDCAAAGAYETLPDSLADIPEGDPGMLQRFTVYGFDDSAAQAHDDVYDAVTWVDAALAAQRERGDAYIPVLVGRGEKPFAGSYQDLLAAFRTEALADTPQEAAVAE